MHVGHGNEYGPIKDSFLDGENANDYLVVLRDV
jgi:hypothetical protein